MNQWDCDKKLVVCVGGGGEDQLVISPSSHSQ
jgi:hypothetical protein